MEQHNAFKHVLRVTLPVRIVSVHQTLVVVLVMLLSSIKLKHTLVFQIVLTVNLEPIYFAIIVVALVVLVLV